MDEKAPFLCQHARGHLGLDTALGKGLSKATTEAAIYENGLHLVEQFVAQS